MRIKKIYKKPIAIFVIIVALYSILILPLHFEKIAERGERQVTLSKELREKIQSETVDMTSEEIKEYGETVTCSLLSFTTSPWLDLETGKAHCVGYSHLCCKIINNALHVNNKEGKATPVVGHIKWFEININNVIKSIMPSKQWENFVKDHDFVEFESPTKHVLFSPTAKDLFLTNIETEL